MIGSTHGRRAGAVKLIIRVRGQGGLGTKGSCVFGPDGGTIGRGPDNTWVLFDPRNEISSLHARIVQEGDDFCMIDESTNGVFVNGSGKAVGRGVKVVLQHGDSLRIGQYQIAVQSRGALADAWVEESADEDWRGIADLFETDPANPDAPQSEEAELCDLGAPRGGKPASGRMTLDPLSAFDRPIRSGAAQRETDNVGLGARPATSPHFTEEDASDLVSRHMDLQTVLEPTEDDIDSYLEQLSRGGTAPLSAKAPPERNPAAEAPARKGIASIETEMSVLSPQNRNLWPLLEGLGFTGTPIPDDAVPAFLREVGAALREAIKGLNATYGPGSDAASRGFRVAVSQLQPFEDNPIKSADDADEAMGLMFANRSPVHLGPEDAVRECLDGLRLHQEAVAAGTAAGLQAVISSFGPQALQQRFAKYGGDPDNPGWLWQMFTQYSTQIGMDNSRGLRRLFDEIFQQAYDRHVRAGGR